MNNKVFVYCASTNLISLFHSARKIEENMSLFFNKIQSPIFIVKVCNPMLVISLVSPLVSDWASEQVLALSYSLNEVSLIQINTPYQ